MEMLVMSLFQNTLIQWKLVFQLEDFVMDSIFFGTRKIFAKVLNYKLVARVGGGFMNFTEIIDTYALMELKKINQ
jgi:hypothetical protein